MDEEFIGGGLDRLQLLSNLSVYDDETLAPVRAASFAMSAATS